ncbi:PPOX class F420-dependent oxidoreductase [Streptomyces sp. NBC_00829]|uniref:PPOX class F420-dependent oxidoreductase n=1 Tax=Streptomyces sp. NBC_00829 TaxID=2903679 RepID=UPI00386B51FF|nr:PPOX class F420-dependent oxidoreductase [Streptomyces sp. NBC_00829]
MAHEMSEEQWQAFVSEGTRTGKLATVRADGSPHIAPVWFLLDGDDLILTTGASTVKGRNLLRDGRVAVCVDDDRPPFSFVTLRGHVEIDEDPEALLDWATRIGERYMGPELAEQYGARNGVPGELLVRVHIDTVVAQADVAG